MFRFRFPVFLILMCSGLALATPAAPVCEVQTSVQLTDYRMSTGSQGSLSIRVRCPDTVRYTLRIESSGLPVSGPNATLLLSSTAGPDVQAKVEVRNVPLNTVFNGTKQFDLALSVPPGQWGLISTEYQVNLKVSAMSVEDGGDQ